MRKFLGVGAAAALALMAHVASADEMSGTIKDIDLTANTFMVGDKLFAASPSNTAGVKLSELKDGDTVKVTYAHTAGYSNNAINALTLMKEDHQ